MTQFSMPWSKASVGDGQTYTFDEWSATMRKLLLTDFTTQGVVQDYLEELFCEATVNPSEVKINTGAAIVYGRYYRMTSDVTLTGLATSSSGYIVAQLINASKTIRVASVGSVTQNAGTQWEIPLAEWSTDGGGTVTLTDVREYAISPLSDETVLLGSTFDVIDISIGSGTGTVTFNNIPQTYTHLMVKGYGITDTVATTVNILLLLNNDSGNNYDSIKWEASSSESPTTAFSRANCFIGRFPGASGTLAFSIGEFEIWIPNYKNTNIYKSVVSNNGLVPNNTTGASYQVHKSLNKWYDTSAITRLDINTNSGNYVDRSSRFTLYGI